MKIRELGPLRSCALVSLLGLAWLTAGTTEDTRPFVSPEDPLEPEEQRQALEVPAGFEIQLVAAEPLIQKPLNLAFDSSGRLWVSHTVDYPYAVLDSQGQDGITILWDFGEDGRARRSMRFADELNLPMGVLPLAESALAFSIHGIWKLKDTDGTGTADQRELLIGGFGYEDTHGLTNSFRRWIDGWIYACHGFRNESTPTLPNGPSLHLQSGNTYRFRENGSEIEQWTWGQVNPFGMAFDSLGNLYTADCHSRPVYMLLRGAYYPSFGKPHDGLGFGPEMIDHDHGSTAIAGVAYYEADHFPSEFQANIFIGNVVTNRIHRNRLVNHGSTRLAETLDDLVVSRDPWFRPVDVVLGPDGALYVADFYNRIIGHYEVPLDHPQRDRHRGRIWRVVYRGNPDHPAAPPRMPVLKEEPTERLLDRLGDPNLTVRTLATNELIDRLGAGAGEAVVSMLQEKRPDSRQRAHAVWVMQRTGRLDEAWIERLAGDESPLVRVHLARTLAEERRWSPGTVRRAVDLLDDENSFVRRAAADALGRQPEEERLTPLLRLWRETPSKDTHLIHTVRMALRNHLRDEQVYRSPRFRRLVEEDEETARRLAEVSLGVHGDGAAAYVFETTRRFLAELDEDELRRWVTHAVRYSESSRLEEVFEFVESRKELERAKQATLLQAIRRGGDGRGDELPARHRRWAVEVAADLLEEGSAAARQRGLELAREFLPSELYPLLERLAWDSSLEIESRETALELLSRIDPARTRRRLLSLAQSGEEPVRLRMRSIQLLAAVPEEPVLEELANLFGSVPYPVALEIARRLSRLDEGAVHLLDAVQSGRAPAELLVERDVVSALRFRPEPVRRRNERLSAGEAAPGRRIQEIIRLRAEEFRPEAADPQSGRLVFDRHCAACHQVAGQGASFGPNLDGIGVRGLERLLEDVLDPNRNLDEAFRMVTVRTTDGRIQAGLDRGTEGRNLVMVDPSGREIRIPLDEIEESSPSELSLMPALYADVLSRKELDDLMAFLLTLR